MKEMHRLIVTSDTYKLASEVDPHSMAANIKADPEDTYLWHFRLQRLEAEPIWDSILTAAGQPGPDRRRPVVQHRRRRRTARRRRRRTRRRAGERGQPARRVHDPRLLHQPRSHAELPPGVRRRRRPRPLPPADPDRHRAAGPVPDEQRGDREAPRRSSPSGCRRNRAATSSAAVDLGYRLAFARPPSASEKDRALTYLENDPARLKGFAWLLFNLDEFIYVR